MIRVEAPAYIPFEPRTEALLALRQRLREALAALDAGPEQLLGARFFGPLPKGADVENALLYNVGDRAFARSATGGVRFEHDPARLAGGGVRYEYGAEAVDDGFRIWTPTRRLAEVCCRLDRVPTLARIWWALRDGADAITTEGTRAPGEPFGVRLLLRGPVAFARPSLVKVLIDGVVCALQSQTDRADAAFTAPLIAGALRADVDRVLEHLLDPRPSALGARARLVHRRGAGVQWSPDDDGCVAGELRLVPDPDWKLSGTAVAVVRASG
jgi:hypothetical protein